MTDAKAFLVRIQIYDAIIDSKIEEVQKLESMITKITPTLRDDAGSGGGFSDKLGDAVAKIVDLRNEINSYIDSYVEMKRETARVMEQLQDPDQYKVLYKRYFEGKTFETIACDMFMTYRNVCYIHGKALQEIEKILKRERKETDV